MWKSLVLALAIGLIGGCTSTADRSTDPPPTTPEPTTAADETLLPFEAAELAGLCESSSALLAEGEPGLPTVDAAIAQFRVEHSILEGFDVGDGRISLRGAVVGSYRIADLPENTFLVTSAEWCYPE